MRSKFSVILLMLTGTVFVGCMPPPELRPREPTRGVAHLKVVSFNVDLKQYADPETIEAVGQTEADVVVLQEVNDGWRAALEERYVEDYPYRAYHGRASGGLAVLSRYPFEDLGVVAGIDGWHPAWHVLVDTDIGPIQVLVVHLKPPYSKREGISGYFNADEAHLREVRTFSESCEEDIPTLVMGDFNESPGGAALSFLEARGFDNILPQFRPGQETWRYERSLYNQAVDTLDHILYQPSALDPLNAYVRYYGNSDHLPVVALFERRVEGSQAAER